MKVCHIVWGMSLGGTENMLVDIINEQIKDVEVTLIVVDLGYEKELVARLDMRTRVHYLNRKPGKKDIVTVLRINWILLSEKADIIHFHTPNLILLAIFKRFLDAKLCATVHDTHISCRQYSKIERIFAISPAVQSDILKRYNIVPRLIFNGIHIDNIPPKSTYGKNDSFSIIQISRFDHKKKGQDLLLHALSKIINTQGLNNISVTFIGDGPSFDYVVRLSRELRIESKCRFVGSKSREYIYSTLKDYDLLVQPSYYEGFGLTVIEGLAAKIPVLVSNIEGPSYLIKDGQFGYLFRCGDITDLSLKIVDIISNYGSPSMLQKTIKGYKYVKEQFDVAETARQYVMEYKNL